MSGMPTAFQFLLARDKDEFHETDHPRKPDGEFAPKGGGGGSSGGGAATAAGGKRLGTLSKEDTQIEFVRARFQTLPEDKAIDVLGSWLDHGAIEGHGHYNSDRDRLEAAGLDPDHLENATNEQIRAALSKDPSRLSGKWDVGRGNYQDYDFPDDELVTTIKSEEGQKKLADMVIEAAKAPNAFESKNSRTAPLGYLLGIITHRGDFRGDVLDHLADSLSSHGDKIGGLKMYSSKYDEFLPSFVDNWASTGGTNAYRRAYVALGSTDGNANKEFWGGSRPLTDNEKVVSKNMQANLQKLYQNTQDFYAKKLAKKGKPPPDLSTEMLTIQRGVGGHFDSYTPAVVESWTIDKATPYRFGKQMGTGIRNEYSILTAQVPYSSVLFSYKSLEGVWPKESSLKGKKEFAVFGGGLRDLTQESFSDVPVYRRGYR